MDELQQALDGIQLPKSAIEPVEDAIPESYTSNNKKEKLLLTFAANFQRQFRQLYGDRKPLFLHPPNEHGVEKFVCSTLRPTQLAYKEIYNYDGCAEFVSGYLSYQTLDKPCDLPNRLDSPTLVLKRQKGNCFDFSVLLCSLLIGVGYDAYCVCGYATKDITFMDQTRTVCPLLQPDDKGSPPKDEGKKPKYSVRPTRDLASKFVKRQEKKEQDRIASEERKKQEEEEARIAEFEKPPLDKYYGLRHHCWVLVLSGKREISQSFYIEPTTGKSYPLDYDQYLGIETLWNHENFWVNMQDCSQGVKNLVFDLGDATKWEYFFPNVRRPLLVVPGQAEIQEEGEEEEDAKDEEKDVKEYFELPPSWVLPIEISPRDFEMRYPRGQKTLLYHRAKQENYAPYLNQDGLVRRLMRFADSARTEKIEIKEEYLHRKDCLVSRVINARNGCITEYFGPGRKGALKEHIHYEPKSPKSGSRTLTFYHNARMDGLVKREITPGEMVEHFEKRDDRLFFRKVVYTKPTKKFEPAEKDRSKQIQSITEKFSHDPALPPNSDVAQCLFLLDERKIHITYHLERNRITSSTREFFLPPVTSEDSQQITMNPDMTSAYQVDTHTTEPKQRVLFEQLEKLLAAQEAARTSIRQSEQETEAILSMRIHEELNVALDISVYDVARNETARRHRQELERKLAEEERIRQEREKDYLAPFIARIGDPPTLSVKEQETVKESCLQDLRSRLVEVANIIQSHFEKETDELQKKQGWYKQKQSSITREEEAEYVGFCADAMFRIHILEQRLNRHKMTAPQKYMELQTRLKNDPRLNLLSH